MSELAMVGNLARVTAAQDSLRRAVERTGSAVQRLDGLFGKAAEAGARLSQVTARPTIAVRDYFSFVIDRLLLQLADLSHTKVDVKLIINDQVIGAAKQLRQLLSGLGGTLSVGIQGGGSAEAKASASVSALMVTAPKTPEKKDTWIDNLLKIAEAFQAFGEGFKAFAEGIKILKELFKGKAANDATKCCCCCTEDKTKSQTGDKTKSTPGDKTKSESSEKTNPQMDNKTKSKAKKKTRPNVAEGTQGEDRHPGRVASQGHPDVHPPTSPKGRLGKLLKGGSKLLKGAGKVAAPLGIGMAALDVITSENKAGAAIQAGAGAGGAALGAALGSAILPGLGTVAGGMLGGWLGDKAGSFIANKWFSGGKKSVDAESKTSLVPQGRESFAANPAQAVPSVSSSAPQAAPSNQYDIKVDGVSVLFPKEEVDKDKLALTIGHKIVSQMNAAMQNRLENGGGAYGQ